LFLVGYLATVYANTHNPRHLVRRNNTRVSQFKSTKHQKPFG
jgi:hypothetical protein